MRGRAPTDRLLARRPWATRSVASDPENDPSPAPSERISLSALLFGSISTIADTSERQRHAFNEAFAEHGLDWQWDRDEYLKVGYPSLPRIQFHAGIVV